MDERKEEVGFLTQEDILKLAHQRFEQRFGSEHIWTGADKFLWEQTESLINISYISATGISQTSVKERVIEVQNQLEQLLAGLRDGAEKAVQESYVTGFLAGRRMLNESN